MAIVSETIPDSLRAEVDAVLGWFNAGRSDEFEVTGIVDADITLASAEPRELRLVLCGGNTCQQQSFQIASSEDGFDISFSNSVSADSNRLYEVQPELDPPPGARRGWLDSVINQHAFVVLVFYRGFW